MPLKMKKLVIKNRKKKKKKPTIRALGLRIHDSIRQAPRKKPDSFTA